MKTSQQKKGQYGEDLAANFLQQNDYELVMRNYTYKRGQIDMIVKTSGVLVFVEVKLRSLNDFGLPEETVTENQQNLIIQTAEEYIEANNWEGDIRFDIIAIELKANLSPQITHFEDAFY